MPTSRAFASRFAVAWRTSYAPNLDAWRRQGFIPRESWRALGELGVFCCPKCPRPTAAPAPRIAYQLVVQDETLQAGEYPPTPAVHSIASHYILDYGTEEQKQRWLPKLISGEMLAGIAMTEPGAGSDLKAIRTKARLDGDHYVVDGSKTFITNGFTANLLVVAWCAPVTRAPRVCRCW